MPRKAWRVRTTKTRVSDVTRVFLETGERPDGNLGTFTLLGDPHQLRHVWATVGQSILEEWIVSHPCSRPWAWWELEAPEPRRRTGGIGAALHTVLAIEPCVTYQVPLHWVRPDHEVCFGVGPAVNTADPPRHESQAAYLDRLGLLSASERDYLGMHPELLNDDYLQP